MSAEHSPDHAADRTDDRTAGPTEGRTPNRFRALVEDGRVHVFDGAMGTTLYERGYFVNVCYDELSLTDPDLVRSVHRAYVEAGAEVLETNTFGANPVKLSSWGLSQRTEEINRRAAELAREAATGAGAGAASGTANETSGGAAGKAAKGAAGDATGRAAENVADPVAVMGAVGPLGIRIEPFGPTSEAEAREYFARQIRGLVQGGVDGFVLETFQDPDELHQALLAAREVAPDLPVVAQMTVGESGATAYGTDVERIARSLTEWGAEVVGLNCSGGPASMLDAIERIARVTDRPISAQPNAGMPRNVGDRKIYMASPEYMAQYARRLIEAGARFVGGCCGTSPEHVAGIRRAVASASPRIDHERVRAGVRADGPRDGEARVPPLSERSELGRKLAAGEWVTSVEVVPERGWKTDRLLSRCRAARDAGIDVVHLQDGSTGQSRMGVIPAALVVEREVGIETMIRYTCRDRNMLGMISDLLGAAAGGLRDILIVSGDPTVTGPYQDATAVFDIDSIGLVNVVHGLNRGMDPGGSPIDAPTRWVAGVSLHPGAVDRKRELERWHWKVEAGADFAVTEPIFEPDTLQEFLDESEASRIPILGGIPLLRSSRDAEFLANEVPGVRVPEAVLERMRSADGEGPDAARAEGILIAREAVESLRAHVQGVQIAANGDVEGALEVVKGAAVPTGGRPP